MKRVVLSPASLPDGVLAETKLWLGITTQADDAALASLLRVALETCEAFTGQRPLCAEIEEVHEGTGAWTALATRPVQAITALEALAPDGARTLLAPASYAVDLDASGIGRFRLTGTAPRRIAVRFTAGLAASWDELPEALRHGVLRLAAHQFRERDLPGAAPLPPAAVAALWRPFRLMRLT